MSFKNTVVPLGHGQKITLPLNVSQKQKSNRAREPVSPRTGRVVGYYPSTKNNRSVAWESQLEEKACNYFEFSTVIASYREQPVSIFFQSQGKLHRYTPDFELVLKTGEVLYVEIKPAYKLENFDLKNKLVDISTFWSKHGYGFIVITDEELNNQNLLRNLKLLRSHQRYYCDTELVKYSIHWIANRKDVNIRQFNAHFHSPAKCLALISQGHFVTDLSKPISLDSKLFLPEENINETCLFSYRVAPNFERHTLSY